MPAPLPSSAAPRAPLKALTGLRFVAASYVVLFHFGAPLWSAAPAWVQSVGSAGYTGVSLFFILSGFILAYSYLPSWEGDRAAFRPFWEARFARVYPVYLLGFVLAAPHVVKQFLAGALPYSPLGLATTAAAALLLVQAWVPAVATLWNVPAWSLSVEAFFYATFPWLAGKARAPLSWRKGAWALLGLWALSVAPGLLYVAFDPDGLGRPSTFDDDAPWLNALKYFPLVRLPEFLAGLVLGRLFLSAPRPGARAATACVHLSFAGLLVAVALSQALPYPLLHNGLLMPLFLCLLYGLALSEAGVGRLLAAPALVLLGEASYAMYILHIPARSWISRALHVALPEAWLGPRAGFVFYFVLLCGLCVAVFRYWEAPARDRLRERFGAARKAQAQVAAPGARP